MKYVAIVRETVVTSVVVVNDDDNLSLVAQVNSADSVVDVTNLAPRPGPEWTWVDGTFRNPSPFPSWEWVDGSWQPPIPYPDASGSWVWNEETGSWDSVINEG